MKICLCGSTRFMDQYNAANRALTLAGHIVYTVAAVSTGNHSEITHDEKLSLDAVHLAKIEESDAIMVVGKQEDGTMYIGDSTRREIMFARLRDKHVYFYDPSSAIEGPFMDFAKDIGAAATSDAMREQLRKEEEKRRQEFMESFRVRRDEDDDGDVDHSDDPEKSSEETPN